MSSDLSCGHLEPTHVDLASCWIHPHTSAYLLAETFPPRCVYVYLFMSIHRCVCVSVYVSAIGQCSVSLVTLHLAMAPWKKLHVVEAYCQDASQCLQCPVGAFCPHLNPSGNDWHIFLRRSLFAPYPLLLLKHSPCQHRYPKICYACQRR